MEVVESPPISRVLPKEVSIEAAGATLTGRRRTNADAFLIDENAALFAVADGMGDSPRSGLVARMALEAVHELFLVPWVLLPHRERSVHEAEDRLALGVAQAHGRLYAPGRPREDRIGTTFAAAVVCGHRIAVVHVGDSRAYVFRRAGGSLVQVTKDDTVLGEAVRRGMPHEEASSWPNAHLVTRMLGATASVDVVPLVLTWAPGDAVLLCTDGVSDRLDFATLARILGGGDDAGGTAREIVHQAVASGGTDNATALVVRRTGDVVD